MSELTSFEKRLSMTRNFKTGVPPGVPTNRREFLATAGRFAVAPLVAGAVPLIAPSSVKAAPPYPGLAYPLPSQAPILLDFGADWLWARGINDGLWKKHAGVDLGANPGTNVLATWDGIVRVAAVDPVWGGWVTIEHTTAQNMCVVYTSVYHHLVIAPGIAQGVAVNRCRILGTVFNPAGRFQPHLHFGIRRGAYRNTSNRGALPRQLPDGPSDPVFAEAFVRPF